MKNLAIIDYDMSVVGGVEMVSSNLANELVKHYNVYLISLNNRNKLSAYSVDDKVHYFSISNETNPHMRRTILKTRKELRRILRDNKIDLTLNMGTYASFVTVMNGFFLKKTKFIFCDHGAMINQIHDKKTTFMRKVSTVFSKHIVVLTDRSMNDYIEKFNVQPHKISRIYNWIDENIYEYESEYNLKSHKIVSSGRFSSEKRYDLLIKVAIELKKMTSDWVWEIYGDGDEFKFIEECIKNNNLECQVVLKGLSDSMYNKYNDYSMLVLTSEREG
ncbi:MAG: glycosyltransferase, partial [Bacilli bacterium]